MRPLDGPQASVNNRLKRGTMDTQRERERERERNQGYAYREKRSLRHRQKMDSSKQREASKETKSADTLVLDF